MGKPYSVDLRNRVVTAIEGGLSGNQAAKQFGIGISTGPPAEGDLGRHRVWLLRRPRIEILPWRAGR
jgi:hypothetical protein